MNEIYRQLRKESRAIIAGMPLPEFCRQFVKEITFSRQMLHSDPLLVRLKRDINPILDDDFGHGMHHSDLVCVDAGAIIQVEYGCRSNIEIEWETVQKKMRMVQVAGLLHDIKRKESEHALKGGNFARSFLLNGHYPLSPGEIEIIAVAIEEHEAFQKEKQEKKNDDAHSFSDAGKPSSSIQAHPTLISNALYDADKFRWGPDNFTHTVWDMVIFGNVPLGEFVKRYPNGIKALHRIKSTFRTATGKRFGPNFIDLGIAVGNRLFQIIRQKYPECFPSSV